MEENTSAPDFDFNNSIHIDTLDYLNYTEQVQRQAKLYGYLVSQRENQSISREARDIIQMGLCSIECSLQNDYRKLTLAIDGLVRNLTSVSKQGREDVS